MPVELLLILLVIISGYGRSLGSRCSYPTIQPNANSWCTSYNANGTCQHQCERGFGSLQKVSQTCICANNSCTWQGSILKCERGKISCLFNLKYYIVYFKFNAEKCPQPDFDDSNSLAITFYNATMTTARVFIKSKNPVGENWALVLVLDRYLKSIVNHAVNKN